MADQQPNHHFSSAELISLEQQYGAHNYHPIPVVCAKAEGVHIWDPEGNRYYDFLSSYSSTNQGHCHPKIVKTLVEQAQRLTLSSRAFYNDMLGRYAKFITEYFGYEMLLPMNTGVEAVETAIKLARKWGYMIKKIPRDEAIVVACDGNFHGRTLAAISMSTDPESRGGFGPYVPAIGPKCPETDFVLEYNNIDQLGRVFEVHGPRIAAFLVEPIQGEAGIVVPDAGYLRRCYDLCQEHNVLFIADEIQTGLGRTGKLLACDYEGVRPDILILGKALSGGVYPASAVLSRREIMLCIGPGEHGSTYGGNPMACAVAIAALEVLRDENLVNRSLVLGERLRQGLRSLNSPVIATSNLPWAVRGLNNRLVRGKGLMNAIVIEEKQIPGKKAWHICLLLKRYGLLTKPTHGNIIRLTPPLVIQEAQVDECVQIIGRALCDIVAWDLDKDPLE